MSTSAVERLMSLTNASPMGLAHEFLQDMDLVTLTIDVPDYERLTPGGKIIKVKRYQRRGDKKSVFKDVLTGEAFFRPKTELHVLVTAPPMSSQGAPMVFTEVALSEVPKYINDDKWFFQQKVDGTRGQLVIEPGKKPWFKNKSGLKMESGAGNKIGDPIVAKLGIPATSGPGYTVDGELLNGSWYVFDMAIDGQESTPWEERMAQAEAWVKTMNDAGITNIKALPTARTATEKKKLYDTVYANGGEGVMMKRKDAKYAYNAKVTNILKAKFVSTADVIVMKKDVGGKDAAEIGVYIGGKLTSVGKVSTLGKETGVNGIGKINVGDVIEVAYLWADPDKKTVYQPRIVKARPDKKGFETEQTDAQLRFVNKEVLDIAPDAVPVGANIPVVDAVKVDEKPVVSSPSFTFDPAAKGLPNRVTLHVGGTEVGFLDWYGADAAKPHTVSHIEVKKEYRRKGYADALWAHAQTLDPQIKHSGNYTPDGAAWLQNLTPKPVSEIVKDGVLHHPSGISFNLPEGAKVRQHKTSPASFLVTAPDGSLLAFVDKNGNVKPVPANIAKVADKNFVELSGHGVLLTTAETLAFDYLDDDETMEDGRVVTLSDVGHYVRKSKSGKVVNVKDYKNKIVPQTLDPRHVNHDRPPMMGTPGQFPANRSTPNVWPHEMEKKFPKPTPDDVASKVASAQSDMEHATKLVDTSKKKALPFQEKLAKAAGMEVKKAPHPKVQEAIDALKEAGHEVKPEKPDKVTGKIRPRTASQLHLLQKAKGVRGPAKKPDAPLIKPKDTAGDLLSRAKAGGFTFDVQGGKPVTKGFVVALPGHTKIFKPDEFTADALQAYIESKAEMLDGDAAVHLGGWYDKKHDEVVLDLVEVHDDKDKAIALGADRNEQAIFDLNTMTEIPTGGTGGREEAANHAGATGQAVGKDVTGGKEAVRSGAGSKDQAKSDLLVPSHEGLRAATAEDRKRLKVPPGWNSVEVSDDPSNPLQVSARDSKGRPKYMYVDAYHEQQAALKFKRMQALHKTIVKLDESLSTDAKTNDTAAAVFLIRRTGLRPGSMKDTKADVQAYGATTLLAKQVKVKGQTVHLDFIGKEGKHLIFDITDPELAAVLKGRVKGKGAEDRLFDTDEEKARVYLKEKTGGNFKVKDLRTYHANVTALAEVKKIKDKPKTLSEFKKARLNIAKIVSAKLGNLPAQALKSYINPTVFSDLMSDPSWSAA